MKSLPLNISFKHHIIIGLIIGIWLALFLIIIAPFDASDLSFSIRLKILPFYGFISFVSYIAIIPIQNVIFKRLKYWNILFETAYILIFSMLTLVGSYRYYRSDIINGDYEFANFTFEIYYPIFFFALIVIVFSRWFLNSKTSKSKNGKIILKGDNKLDVLNVELSVLVCIASAGNYVEVNYLKEGILKKKLLRTTLKKIHSDTSDLLKVHRSYLINPIHFKDWKNSSTIQLTQMEVPVSKNYKENLMVAMNHSSQKTASSSLSL